MGSEWNQPLLSSDSAPPSLMAPRILDRDGTFSQSRGRWSVSDTAPGSSLGFGSARQRRAVVAAPSAVANANAATQAPGGGAGAVPFGVAPPSPSPSRHSPNSSSCNWCCRANNQPTIERRCWDDWFHSLSYTPTCVLILGVFVAYFITVVLFAGLYLAVNRVGEYYGNNSINSNDVSLGLGAEEEESAFCGMDIGNHMEALYFSLSTMATIGYGTSDYYFGDCWTPFILVLLQVFSAIVFSSLAIGLLFQRISRGQKRGRTIVFSDVAVIRKVRGRWYWMFRLSELRKRYIIGAKARVFCVRHERCPVAMVGGEGGDTTNGRNNIVELETAHFVSHPLPLLNGGRPSGSHSPAADANEEGQNLESSFEQCILMGLPHVVVHSMDSSSPMMPPRPVWYDEGGVPNGIGTSPLTTPSEGLIERTAEESTAGNSVAPSSLLAASIVEGEPIISSNSLLYSPRGSIADQPTKEEITHFLQDRQAEIIVSLEGTCEVTGIALQARHSYRMEDIAFHQTFAPCVFPTGANASTTSERKWWNPFATKSKSKVDQNPKSQGSSGSEVHGFQGKAALEIDFSQFHDLLPVPCDSMSCPYIPPSSLRSP